MTLPGFASRRAEADDQRKAREQELALVGGVLRGTWRSA
jgi:hypothetical protein